MLLFIVKLSNKYTYLVYLKEKLPVKFIDQLPVYRLINFIYLSTILFNLLLSLSILLVRNSVLSLPNSYSPISVFCVLLSPQVFVIFKVASSPTGFLLVFSVSASSLPTYLLKESSPSESLLVLPDVLSLVIIFRHSLLSHLVLLFYFHLYYLYIALSFPYFHPVTSFPIPFFTSLHHSIFI